MSSATSSASSTRGRLGIVALLIMLGTLAFTTLVNAATSRQETLTLELSSGRAVKARIETPVQDVPSPLPAILLFGGFGSAERVLEPLAERSDFLRATFPYPWEAPDRLRPWDVPSVLRDFDRAVQDTLEGIGLLVQALRDHPAVDGQQIYLVGASAGAPFATIVGAQEQVPGVVIVQGFGDVGGVIGRQFEMSLAPKVGDWIKPLARALGRYIQWQLDLPSPEAAAREFVSEQRVLMMNAADDVRIPLAATNTLWEAIENSSAQATRLDLEGDHLRGIDDPDVKRLLDRAVEWMHSSNP